MRKLKIVLILSRLNIGGTASHAILLTEHLQDEQFETHLITGREDLDEGNMLDLAEAKGVRPLLLESLRRSVCPPRDLIAGVQIWRILRRLRPDIVHTHASKAGFLGRLAASLAGVPIRVHTFHGHVLQEYFSGPVSRLLIGIERFLVRRTDVIIGVSREVCDQLIAMGIGDAEKVRHIPLGLELEPLTDCERYRGQLHRELGLTEDIAMVGIIARLAPIKGHKDFLRAAKLIHDQRPGQVKFLLVGDGPLREPLREQAHQLGLDEAVLFTGFRQDLVRLYSDLDVVALSSYNEGLPVTLVEGFAAGRPAVATRVGGVPELIEDGVTGFLVDAGDAAAMADRIGWLLDHPEEARAMGLRGRERVIPTLSVERLLNDLRGLYTELARKYGLFAIPD